MVKEDNGQKKGYGKLMAMKAKKNKNLILAMKTKKEDFASRRENYRKFFSSSNTMKRNEVFE